MSKRDGDCVLHHGQFMIPAVTHGKFMIQATCVPPMIRNRCNKVFSACDTSMLRRMIGKQMSLCLFQKKQMSLCVEHWCTHMMLLCFFLQEYLRGLENNQLISRAKYFLLVVVFVDRHHA
jgi:hypothetical protein